MINAVKQTDIDNEWVKLLEEARRIGMTLEEVKLFLSEATRTNN